MSEDIAAGSTSPSSTSDSNGQLEEVGNNPESQAGVEKTPVVDAGPSTPPPKRVLKVYATTAEAIANFKPTPREVIRGIAPHVFDERKRRRSQKRAPKPYWYMSTGEKRSSPLRGAAVISWDEHSIYLEQPEPPKRATSPERSEPAPLPVQVRDSISSEQRAVINTRRVKLQKSGWKHFRVDVHLFRTIGVKLKSVTSLNVHSSGR
ncbi:hypothetical protein GALMADRAFT_256671 [Galerina marginata CBS 339.88]|uniref:Uncharacterized protein n=1 Tax=Galerina marginata (strain CBS 339.88) TaxID=685588 RepID=A0A067SM66_GALM3|nr:hypothetical protein GALMADRAFT_256671 [Galerina marginata CBS 339.88]